MYSLSQAVISVYFEGCVFFYAVILLTNHEKIALAINDLIYYRIVVWEGTGSATKITQPFLSIQRKRSNRKAMKRNWSNQKANPALKTKIENK